MFIFAKPTCADEARIRLLTTELHRKRDFAAQLRDEASGAWAEDYLALAELEDAKADVIETQLGATTIDPAIATVVPGGSPR